MGSWFSKGASLDDWREETKLSYTVYWILACIPFLNLEQLYLGSPKTFLLKHFMNMAFLGFPWIYEVFMATWAQPQVKLYGSPNPFTTSIEVGGGRFAKEGEEPGPLHYRPLLYVIGLILGIFGGDSFVMGNYTSGFFRLFCTLSVFLLPISVIWWAYKVFLYVFVTDSVYAQDGKWFGYPSASNVNCPYVLDQFMGWLLTVANVLTSPFPPINALVMTMITTFQLAKGFTVSLWGFVVNNAAAAIELSNKVSNIEFKPGDVEKAKSEEQAAAATVAATAATAATTAATTPGQTGGGLPVLDTSSALGALLTGTIGFILVSSIVLSWRRTYQNTNAITKQATTTTTTTATTVKRPGEGDDVPPEPRGPRETPQGA